MLRTWLKGEKGGKKKDIEQGKKKQGEKSTPRYVTDYPETTGSCFFPDKGKQCLNWIYKYSECLSCIHLLSSGVSLIVSLFFSGSRLMWGWSGSVEVVLRRKDVKKESEAFIAMDIWRSVPRRNR